MKMDANDSNNITNISTLLHNHSVTTVGSLVSPSENILRCKDLNEPQCCIICIFPTLLL